MSDNEGPNYDQNNFIDDIAADDDDPDAPDEDEGDMGLDDYEAESGDEEEGSEPGSKRPRVTILEEDEALHQQLDQKREQDENERMEREIELKYGGDAGDMDDYGKDEVDFEATAPRDLLPGLKDPKLFLVSCDPGKEQEAVWKLMSKYYARARLKIRKPPEELEEHERPLFITSAFCTPAAKAYIYIEAPKEVHVKRAILGIRLLKWWDIKLVNINEMVEAVRVNVKSLTVRPKQWVRIRSGIYKGDLAFVVAVMDQGTEIEVKMVPRLDLASMQEDYDLQQRGEKKRKRKRGVRPLQKLFNSQQIEGMHMETVVTRKNEFYHYKSMRFRHGYMYRTMKSNRLTLGEVYPTKDEIERFQQRHADADSDASADEDEMMGYTGTMKQAPTFVKDDRVRVVSRTSDLFNLTGRVAKVLNGVVTVRPDLGQRSSDDHNARELPQTDFKPNEIKKYFEVGDHIKIVGGKYVGQTGFIIQIKEKEDSVVIHSDLGATQMTVYAQDVIESTEICAGRDTVGQFALHDLVQVGQKSVGCIIKCEDNACKVLSCQGIIKSHRLQEITRKRNTRFATALDGNGEEICTNDIVTVKSGPYKDQQGTIKHIFHQFVFLYSETKLENTGIFVAHAKACVQVGGDRIRYGTKKRSARTSRINHRKDPLFQKTVTILRGEFAGFLGIVVDIVENGIRVELHAEEKTVTVERRRPDGSDCVQIQNTNEKAERPTNSGRTKDNSSWDSGGSRTPSFLGAQSPWHGDDGGGGKTPAHPGGGMTPSRDYDGMSGAGWPGDSSPDRDVWSSMTPRRTPNHVPETPKFNQDEVDIELNPNWQEDNDEDEEELRKTVATPREDRGEDRGVPTPRDVPITPVTPHTNVPQTPLENEHDVPTTPHEPAPPATPTPATPASMQTPKEEIKSERCPPSTPMPSTPFDAPDTPSEATPYAPSSYESVSTPAYDLPPETPLAPTTPADNTFDDDTAPETPMFNPSEAADDDDNDDDEAVAVSNALKPGVYVWLRPQSSDLSGPIEDDEDEGDLVRGYITSVNGSKLTVEMDAAGGMRTVSALEAKAVIPSVHDLVLIIDGENVGQQGELIAIHNQVDFIVETTLGAVNIVEEKCIVKFRPL